MTKSYLTWVMIALFITLEVELMLLGVYWLVRNQKKKKEAAARRKRKADKIYSTYSVAPCGLLLAGIFSDYRVEIVACVILAAAIFFVAVYHLHCLWGHKDEVEQHIQYVSDLEETEVELQERFTVEADEKRPMSVKLPVCTLSIDENATAGTALSVSDCSTAPVETTAVRDWQGNVTRRVWPILITNMLGQEIGNIQPILVEKHSEESPQPILPLKVDNTQNGETLPLQSVKIKNKRGEIVGVVKPLVVENADGQLVGSAEPPLIRNANGDIIGIARPIVAVNDRGVALGTIAPNITADRYNRPVQSVLLFDENEDVTIPLAPMSLADLQASSVMVLPQFIVSGEEKQNELPEYEAQAIPMFNGVNAKLQGAAHR